MKYRKNIYIFYNSITETPKISFVKANKHCKRFVFSFHEFCRLFLIRELSYFFTKKGAGFFGVHEGGARKKLNIATQKHMPPPNKHM